MRSLRPVLSLWLFTCLLAPVAQAEIPIELSGATSCRVAYEKAADEYWPVLADMMQFKALFDDYDRLCTLHYKEEIESLQPLADRLRVQTGRDIGNSKKAIAVLFDTTIPQTLSKECAGDSASRDHVKKKFIAAMNRHAKTLELRLKKSAKTLQAPKESLTLCQKLGSLAPRVEKVLGKELENPLLEMSILHRNLTRKPRIPRHILKNYRNAVENAVDKPVGKPVDKSVDRDR